MASMNESYISSLNFASSATYFYTSIPLMIIGVIGGLLNVIIFRSLRIYRQSSSAFYLMVVSMVNIGQLLTGLLPRVLVNGFGIYWTESLDAFCKIRYSLFQACSVISPTCLCLATIDQFLGTSSNEQWRQWSDIRIARYSCLITIIVWFIYGIPYAIFYSPSVSPWTGVINCSSLNASFLRYINMIHAPVFMCGLPFLLTTLFSILSLSNVNKLSHRTVPIIRRRHENQLTVMVLVQAIVSLSTTTPSFILRTISAHVNLDHQPIVAAQLRFAIALTTAIYYVYYSIPFYLYIGVSERFRRQCRYVFIHLYLYRCRKGTRNTVAPVLVRATSQPPIQPLTIEQIELTSECFTATRTQ